MEPFDIPRPYCPAAWQGAQMPGRRIWLYWPGTQQVATRGVQQLLHMAQLPRAELLHMGCPSPWLEYPPPDAANCELVAPLLGRIVLDAREVVWAAELQPEALALGLAVIRRWFVRQGT